eukprot:TRINITY_DN1373_c0_g1_i14.p1 TRINITY_DN1373_c0_g1~~TRINITY_DN1373_c0_g1_i14.p1  ORF type:complete len:682 (-),score=202.94 TRINITY_DN1373_c0_g1_i14:28-2073(-)
MCIRDSGINAEYMGEYLKLTFWMYTITTSELNKDVIRQLREKEVWDEDSSLGALNEIKFNMADALEHASKEEDDSVRNYMSFLCSLRQLRVPDSIHFTDTLRSLEVATKEGESRESSDLRRFDEGSRMLIEDLRGQLRRAEEQLERERQYKVDLLRFLTQHWGNGRMQGEGTFEDQTSRAKAELRFLNSDAKNTSRGRRQVEEIGGATFEFEELLASKERLLSLAGMLTQLAEKLDRREEVSSDEAQRLRLILQGRAEVNPRTEPTRVLFDDLENAEAEDIEKFITSRFTEELRHSLQENVLFQEVYLVSNPRNPSPCRPPKTLDLPLSVPDTEKKPFRRRSKQSHSFDAQMTIIEDKEEVHQNIFSAGRGEESLLSDISFQDPGNLTHISLIENDYTEERVTSRFRDCAPTPLVAPARNVQPRRYVQTPANDSLDLTMSKASELSPKDLIRLKEWDPEMLQKILNAVEARDSRNSLTALIEPLKAFLSREASLQEEISALRERCRALEADCTAKLQRVRVKELCLEEGRKEILLNRDRLKRAKEELDRRVKALREEKKKLAHETFMLLLQKKNADVRNDKLAEEVSRSMVERETYEHEQRRIRNELERLMREQLLAKEEISELKFAKQQLTEENCALSEIETALKLENKALRDDLLNAEKRNRRSLSRHESSLSSLPHDS